MTTRDYVFRTVPFAHQEEVFHATAQTPAYGLFWEQGCGKTKPILDTAAYLYQSGEISALVVVAPNGVHRIWATDEVPAHWPVSVPLQSLIYYSASAGTREFQRRSRTILQAPGMVLLVMTYDATLTSAGEQVLTKFLQQRRCLFVLDEAHRIKTPSAKRTRTLLRLAKYAPYRRVLTGTPVANGPFDAYSIMRFLDLNYWKPYGLDSYYIFQHYFGIFAKGMNRQQGREYEYVVRYRNLEHLEKLLAKCSHRVTKDQVLDLPPKLYGRRYFTMSPEQSRLYKSLEDDFVALLGSSTVSAPLAITRMLRLQQVTSGFLPTDDGTPAHDIPGPNPRLSLLAEVLEDTPHSAIVWARFRKDIDKIMELLGGQAVRYDGAVSDEKRAQAKELFQSGQRKYFVCNNAINEGLTLTQARTVIYYSNTFKLTDRLQSEDRCHRPGQEHPVNYIDLVGEQTLDEYILEKLRAKKDIASRVMGDEIKLWIQARSM